MSLYVIGDTHFTPGGDKPMDVFGGRWVNYRQKLIDSISSIVKPDDTLVVCGDFSWGMSLEETLPDFELLDSLPGRKILLKGNHDYWWETAAKMKNFLAAHEIHTISFLHNNFFQYGENLLLCGTRGWMYDKDDPASADEKIFKREVIRLEQSLSAAKRAFPERRIMCFLHYPPLCRDTEISAFTDLLKQYGVSRCCYGHLHSDSIKTAFKGEKSGVFYSLVSADAVDFKPVLLAD